MNQDDFDKLYFKAKLTGINALGELLLQLMEEKDNRFAMQLYQLHNQDYDDVLSLDAVTKDRVCDKSPYHYCFSVPLGKNIEHFDPDTFTCIWCGNMYSVDLTKTEQEYIAGDKVRSVSSIIMDIVQEKHEN